MSNKGFTFAQMATLILVILGLTVGVILASTQLRSSASSISELGGVATEGTQAAVTASAGLACSSLGGNYCTDSASCDTFVITGGTKTTSIPDANNQGGVVGCSSEDAPYCCYALAETGGGVEE